MKVEVDIKIKKISNREKQRQLRKKRIAKQLLSNIAKRKIKQKK